MYKKDEQIADDWFFDIGYHFGFSITVFIVVFMFSCCAPLIPLFGFLFFMIKVSKLVFNVLVFR